MKLRLLVLLIASLHGLQSGCRSKLNSGVEDHACCTRTQSVASTRPLPDASVYQLNSEWADDLGKRIKLSALRGRVQVVTLFFANCQMACPLLVHDMRRIEEGLPPTLRERVGFTLVSIDPDRDTAQALNEYRERPRLDSMHLTLLRGAT